MLPKPHPLSDLPSKSVEINRLRAEHQSVVVQRGVNYYASCLCGWSTDIDTYEKVDLLRAIHAHDVITFAKTQEK